MARKLKKIIVPDSQGNPVEYEVDAIDANMATAGQSPIADGAGGWQWGDVQGGGSATESLTVVTSVAQMTDASKKYVMNGWVYQHETITVEDGTVIPNFTNQIPISTDESGAVLGYKTGYRLNSSGAETEQTGDWVTGFIPANKGDVFNLKGVSDNVSGSNGLAIGFYKADHSLKASIQLKQIYNGAEITYVTPTFDGNSVTKCEISTTSSLNDLSYVRFTGNTSNPANAYIAKNEELTFSTGGGTRSEWVKKYQYVAGESQLDGIEGRVSAVESKASKNESSIASLSLRVKDIEDNGVGGAEDDEPLTTVEKYAEQLDRARQIGYKSNDYLGTKVPLNFLHISDTHGSVNAQNAVEILNHLYSKAHCNFMVHTGDFHADNFADDFTAFAGYLSSANAPVFLTSGNHDVGNNRTSGTGICTDAQLYAKCFEPYMSGWNPTSHPTGKCYYYKDFADSAIRFIVLHDFESDYNGSGTLSKGRGYCAYTQAQIDWLINALMTCPADYGVVIAHHNPVNIRGKVTNPFNSEYLVGRNTGQYIVDHNIIPDIVQAFKDGTSISKTYQQTAGVVTTLNVSANFASKNTGAEFVCYLCGHAHADGICFLQDYPKQLELNIGCDNFHYQHYSDTYNEQDTLHQDLINYVSIDRNTGMLYVQRIGNDFTAQADRRDFVQINYRNDVEENPAETVAEPVYEKLYEATTTTDENLNLTGLSIKECSICVLYPKVSIPATTYQIKCSSKQLVTGYHGAFDATSASYPAWMMNIMPKHGWWWSENVSAVAKNSAGIYPYMYSTGYLNMYSASVETYKKIDTITTDVVVPAGTKITIWGIRT